MNTLFTEVVALQEAAAAEYEMARQLIDVAARCAAAASTRYVEGCVRLHQREAALRARTARLLYVMALGSTS
jgi:hypothetical protein